MPPRVPEKRLAEDPISDGSATKQTRVEKHDSAFYGPLQLFKSNPTNETFVECRHVKLRAIPEDYDADSYTFMYRGTSFGVILSSQAELQCNMTIRRGNANNSAPIQGIGGSANDGAENGVPDAGAAVWPVPLPLRNIWKSKDIYINDDVVNTNTNADNYVSWVRHLATEVKKDYIDSEKISINTHPTPSLTGNRFFTNVLAFNICSWGILQLKMWRELLKLQKQLLPPLVIRTIEAVLKQQRCLTTEH